MLRGPESGHVGPDVRHATDRAGARDQRHPRLDLKVGERSGGVITQPRQETEVGLEHVGAAEKWDAVFAAVQIQPAECRAVEDASAVSSSDAVEMYRVS